MSFLENVFKDASPGKYHKFLAPEIHIEKGRVAVVKDPTSYTGQKIEFLEKMMSSQAPICEYKMTPLFVEALFENSPALKLGNNDEDSLLKAAKNYFGQDIKWGDTVRLMANPPVHERITKILNGQCLPIFYHQRKHSTHADVNPNCSVA